MSYIEEIKEAYELVRKGKTSPASVQKALQYENWLNLPSKITRKVINHSDYPLLAADREQPIPDGSQMPQDCQMPGRRKRISLAYSLDRSRKPSLQLNMIDTDDLPQLWEMLERDQKRGKSAWITTNHLTLRTEHDLHDLVCRLGLYHWRKTVLNTTIFCLELRNIECVKPSAIDARLAFYFHQTPRQVPGRTRNLETGEPDMEEWLCLEINNDSIKCVGGCFTRQKVELKLNDYYKNSAQRMRG